MKIRSMLMTLISCVVLASCGGSDTAQGGADTVSTGATVQGETGATVQDDGSGTSVNGIPVFNADSAYSFIKSQVGFGPRVPGSEAHKACGDYLAAALKRLGADTVMVQNAQVKAFNGDQLPISNILGQFNAGAKNRVLLLAHWDSRPWADSDPDPANREKPIDGANDGASGVGVLLEVARQISASNPGMGVDILFVDAEDYGTEGSNESWCLGTKEWVKAMPYTPDNRPAYGILLDMVGGKDAKFYREQLSNVFARPTVDRVWEAGHEAGYGDRFVYRMGPPVTDDHVPLCHAGIPTIDIIEAYNSTTGTFPATWHTLDDNLQNIDKATLKAVGQTLMQLLYGK